mmetsp:Transcript_22149/g.64304  ORF Transcript_22149/g.64304 Transcript_22149/m.64304 type:complete len:279 (-) Transcript_22149:684-1520(-)
MELIGVVGEAEKSGDLVHGVADGPTIEHFKKKDMQVVGRVVLEPVPQVVGVEALGDDGSDVSCDLEQVGGPDGAPGCSGGVVEGSKRRPDEAAKCFSWAGVANWLREVTGGAIRALRRRFTRTLLCELFVRGDSAGDDPPIFSLAPALEATMVLKCRVGALRWIAHNGDESSRGQECVGQGWRPGVPKICWRLLVGPLHCGGACDHLDAGGRGAAHRGAVGRDMKPRIRVLVVTKRPTASARSGKRWDLELGEPFEVLAPPLVQFGHAGDVGEEAHLR